MWGVKKDHVAEQAVLANLHLTTLNAVPIWHVLLQQQLQSLLYNNNNHNKLM